MRDWWNEQLYLDCHQGFLIKKALYEKRSAFQHIQVLDTVRFGRALALDGIVQTTEADEFIYHEMLVHPAMMRHGNPARAAIIGGGDGGAARELLRWTSLLRLELVEIDPDVIDVSRRFLPSLSQGAFEDSRLVVRIHDGSKFIKSSQTEYDIILIDSSDPVGPATSLFSDDFYAACIQNLRKGGVLVAQCGAPFLAGEQLQLAFSSLSSCVDHVAVYVSAVPTYYGGSFAFLIASNSCHFFAKYPAKVNNANSHIARHTRHFSHTLNENLFAVPKWLASTLDGRRPPCKQCGF